MLTLSDLRTIPQAVLELLVALQPLRGPATYAWLSDALRVGRAAVYARVLAARRLGLVTVAGEVDGKSGHRGGRGKRQLVALTPSGRRVVGGALGDAAPSPGSRE